MPLAKSNGRVLENGTGTGLVAALLCELLGAEKVTSVEIDPQVAAHAAKSLADVGCRPTLVVGNGSSADPPGSPFARIINTFSVCPVPYSLIRQSEPGGIIVTPYAPGLKGGRLLKLVVGDDGTAQGSFVGDAHFMRDRTQKPPPAPEVDMADGREEPSELNPRTIVDDFEACAVVGMFMPGARLTSKTMALEENSWAGIRFWLNTPDGSWCCVDWDADDPEGPYECGQYGPRNLWDEAVVIYQNWLQAGKPERKRFGLRMTEAEQQITLDGVPAAWAM